MSTKNKIKWVVDPAHSEILFKVKHMVISSVTGKFDKFDAIVFSSEEDFTDMEAHFTAEVDSINTHQSERDAHLKSVDFFDAAHFPNLSFRSTGFSKTAGDEYLLTGDITIRETTKPIVLQVNFGGVIRDPWGMIRAGFELSGTLNRKDFGLQWSVLTETGGMVAGDEVKLMLNVELIKQTQP